MESALTWTQFATVMSMLTVVFSLAATMAGYFLKQRFDAIDAKLETLATKDELRIAILNREIYELDARIEQDLAKLQQSKQAYDQEWGALQEELGVEEKVSA